LKFIYTLSFLFGADNWKIDPTPQELTNSLNKLDKEKAAILDLGCGDGHNCLSLAQEGWSVTGVDFIPLAISRAKAAARKAGLSDKAQFMVGDVSQLDRLDLPQMDFAYDLGCFHLFGQEQANGYIQGLTNVVKQDGLFLLKAFSPRVKGSRTVGYKPEAIEELFKPYFKLEKTSDHSYWRFPANWYWLRRK
jgi:cyclopropane fatty-acyl-phospholipid synthase-like methyltransferase